jgi:phenylacetic acid degradation operon negative regulatory protein
VKPTAKRFVLELLTAADSHRGSIANLVAAADVLGIDEGNVRVAVTRLVAAGALEPVERGEYRLGAATRALTTQLTSWRDLETQVRRWDGSWACVQVGDLGRTDRSALRKRERALRLYGFRELARGLSVRPDNLVGGVDVLRTKLVSLGIEPAAIVFRASELDAETDAGARSLWDRDRLTATYRQVTARIDRFITSMVELSPRVVAREAFLFGGDVLRMIIFDPRLPAPLVDVQARRALVDAMKRLDTMGRRSWTQLFGMPHRLVINAQEHHEYS